MKKFVLRMVAIFLFSVILVSCSAYDKKTNSSKEQSPMSSSEPSYNADIFAKYRNLKAESKPVCQGNFIQNWLYQSWSPERLDKEIKYMHDTGMKYLIIAPMASQDSAGIWTSAYPTKIPGIKNGTGDEDYVGSVLHACQKYQIKVFIGLNESKKWAYNGSAADMDPQMEMGNKVADELYARYHKQYSDVFYGWYWTEELANFPNIRETSPDRQKTIDCYAGQLDINLDHLSKLDASMPVMLSPYFRIDSSTAKDNYLFWRDLIQKAHFRKGDILCPQDSIGAEGTTLEYLETWLISFRMAVDDSHKGVEFWVNNECFVAADWSSATLDRFVDQMKISSKFADCLISFAPSHYYSPYIIDPGYTKTYEEYLATGELEKDPPSAPQGLTATLLNKKTVQLHWSASHDNIGISGYRIYRNHTYLGMLNTPHADHDGNIAKLKTEYTDDISKLSGQIVYEVVAVDFAGNYSSKCSISIFTK